jgi:hypothetical protein
MDCIAVSRLRCLSVVGAPAAEAALDFDLDVDLLAMFQVLVGSGYWATKGVQVNEGSTK